MIVLTEAAANKLQKQMTRRGSGLGIRIGVKTTGCSGLAYTLEYVDQEVEHDKKMIYQGFNVYIDPKAVPYIQNMIVDYVRMGLNEGFEFKNPNEKDKCGCGESFRV